jgi:hypothetical protein
VAKKKVLGVDPLSWIKPTVRVNNEETQEIKKKEAPRTNKTLPPRVPHKSRNLNMPKFQTYEIKLTVRLKEEQLEFLSRLEREIMKNRSRINRGERITKNSIIRAIIDIFKNLNIDTSEISDEDKLIRKLKRTISKK